MKKADVYTRTGDKGTTSLLSGERVPKQSLRVEAYGNIDEVRASLGMARATVKREDVKETIYKIQELLMSLMADVASINLEEPYIKAEHVTLFEETIDRYDALFKWSSSSNSFPKPIGRSLYYWDCSKCNFWGSNSLCFKSTRFYVWSSCIF